MNSAREASTEIRSVEDLAHGKTVLHGSMPLWKLTVTMVFIIVTASFGKYELFAIMPMILLPLIGYFVSLTSVAGCFRRLRLVLPVVLLVGIVNPFLDRETAFYLFGIPVSFGIISMLTLMYKGILCILASYLLVATTPVDELCLALRRIKCPRLICSLLLLTFRNLQTIVDEAATMNESYLLRAPGQNGIRFSAWGSFLGGLIIRSDSKAGRIGDAMELRGFRGEFHYASRKYLKVSHFWAPVLIALTVCLRLYDITSLIGRLFVR